MNTTVDIYEKYKKPIDELTKINPELGNFYKGEFLIKEAKKRGFNNIGDLKIKNTYGCIRNGFVTLTNNFYYDYKGNTLRLDGALIFNNGVWAEIIEEEKPTQEEIDRVINYLKNK